ncbi:hypothetical protein LTS17_010773 [Exophiala oligosperma]
MAETNDQYDLYNRPPTPPDSPLRWKFTPKELASLRHVPTPPGVEQVEAEPEQMGAGDTKTNKPPKVPFKPPNLETTTFPPAAGGAEKVASNPTFVPEAQRKSNRSDMAGAFASQPQCLNSLPEKAERAISATEPYFHRHETIYKRVFTNGEPVETITQTCEISGLDPSERVVENAEEEEEESMEQPKTDEMEEESLCRAKKNARLNSKCCTCEDEEEDLGGIFV